MARKKRATIDGDGQITEFEVDVPDVPAAETPQPTAAGSDLFDEVFGPAAPLVPVTEVELDVNGAPRIFRIKTHSIADAARIRLKGYRGEDGKLIKDDVELSLNLTKHHIAESVVHNTGTAEAPNWQPLFTAEQIARQLNDPRREVKLLLHRLANQVWVLNDELNPFLADLRGVIGRT